MRRGECGTTYPPAEDSPDREELDTFRDVLRLLHVPPGTLGRLTPLSADWVAAWAGRWTLLNDPELRAWCGFGAA